MFSEITSAFLTTSGATVSTAGGKFRQPATFTLEQRSAAAAAAGFTAIGASAGDTIPARLPCPVRELEWFDLTQPDWRALDHMLAMADMLMTVRRLHTGSAFTEGTGAGSECMVLGALAERCAAHGLIVCVEPVAFGRIRTLAGVRRMIAGAGPHANIGVLYDTWQQWRTAGALEVPEPGTVASVQVSGVSPVTTASPLHDAMRRMLPGHGVAVPQTRALLAALAAQGYAGPLCAEVPSAAFRRRRDPALFAREVMASLNQVMPREEMTA